jgi:hypothetical protein
MDKFKIVKEGHTVLKDGREYKLNNTVELSEGSDVDRFGRKKTWLQAESEVKKAVVKDNKKDEK